MIAYLARRLVTMVWTLIAISILVFIIIQLPPGDYLTTYISEIQAQGEEVAEEQVAFLREQYGLDKPMWQQYLVWATGLLRGDLGYSFEYNQPVSEVIGDRMFLTMILNLLTVIFVYVVSFPIGVYSATHQYSWADHSLSFLGFLGLATPNFLLALILLYLANVWFGTSIGGLMDPEYVDQPWSVGKALSVLEHLWVPVLVIGLSGTAGMIRRLRANLLDELQKQYVTTARAKGVSEGRLLRRYPLRMALNPFVADIGSLLPQIISGSVIVSAVMSLPTTGPMLLSSLRSQDMYLAGSFLMFLAVLTVVGMLVSDILLAILDPRIRLAGGRGAMSIPLGHYVSEEAFDPEATVAAGSEPSERYLNASQGQIIWWRFLRHRLAFLALIFLGLSYGSILVTEILAPYDLHSRHTGHIYAPPQRVHLFHEGRLVGPFVYPFDYELDMDTLKREYTPDTTDPQPIRFFCSGEEYRFWNLFAADFHLMCPPQGGTLFLLGTDRLGRDMLSRLLYGGRISLTVGLVGVTLSYIIGIFVGGMAGYFGGFLDFAVQRVTEVLRSIPELPLWMALSAALPVTWDPRIIYFGITIILALLDWPSIARAVRSKLFALREEDYVAAAEMMGAKPQRIILRHLLPNFTSHLIASASLSIPSMILAETALSFLGLGLRPPITSWGVLLSESQNIEAVALYPWLLMPMLPVMATVLAFSFLGDGLRDAIDPHE